MSEFLPRKNRRVLIVDDNPSIHEDVRKVLATAAANPGLDALEADMFGTAESPKTTDEAELYEIESAMQGEEGVAKVRQGVEEGRPFSVAFVDMRMPPGLDGVETIERMWQHDENLLVVICTAYSDYSREQIIGRLGRTHRLLILKKPFDNSEVSQLACALTEKWWKTKCADMQMAALETMVASRTRELSEAVEQLSHEMGIREEAEQKLRASEERFALAAAGSNDGVWDWDLKDGAVYYSERWEQIAGMPAGAARPRIEEWMDRVHPNDRHGVRAALEAHLAGQIPSLEVEHRLRRDDGCFVWVLCRGLAVLRGREAVRIAGSLTDISRQKADEDELRKGAYYDRLTGLPNRALLKSSLQRALGRGSRCAVLFLDCDRFKLVNDSLGHQVGDQLLVAVASRMAVAPKGKPGIERTVARLGGDEFVVLMDNISDLSDAVEEARRLQVVLGPPFQIGSAEVYCNASIGIAVAAGDYGSPDELLRDADTAMYYAKTGGGARYAVFDRSMRDRAIARLRLETELRRAIDNCEFRLEYQPIVSLDTGRARGLEALLRWNHADFGNVSPADFIPIAEETGLIVPLGSWVVREACRQMRSWRDGGCDAGRLAVAVNLSQRQLAQPDLVESIDAALREFDLPGGCLNVEVTESAVMDDLETSVSVLTRLREKGVGIHMDDFGTGYSSLSCLRKLPITALKVDRSFAINMGFANGNPAIIHAIVTLARNLKMEVISEGIETSEQLAGVIALDCDMVQGFYFGKPMTPAGLEQWLNTQAAQRVAA